MQEQYDLLLGNRDVIWLILSKGMRYSLAPDDKMAIVQKLGILMSVYHSDDPALLDRALESILLQEISAPSEIRIYLGVDGPIPDSLQVVINRYKPYIYKLLIFKSNRGLASVLNELIRVREDEEFFFRMDADDRSSPQRLDRQLAHMRMYPEVDILGTDMWEIDISTGQERTVRFGGSRDNARKSISRRVPVAHPTVCFRARVFQSVQEYPEIRFNEDVAMWFACLKAGMIFDNLHEPLYYFTIGDDFWRRRSVLKAWTECMIYVKGIWTLDGLTWKYIYPFIRLLIRLGPKHLQRAAYSSSLRLQKST